MPPIPGLPPGAIELVRPHLKRTVGYVLAASGDCLDIQAREVDTIKGRRFQSVHPDRLESLDLPESWILATVMCPGDTTDAIARFTEGLNPGDRQRIRFYWYPGTRPADALKPWLAAGLGPIQEDDIDGWERFHKLFGAHHSIQVFMDHVGRGPATAKRVP